MNNSEITILITGIAFGAIVSLFVASMIYLYIHEKRKNRFKYGCVNCHSKDFKLVKVNPRTIDGIKCWIRSYKCINCGMGFDVGGKVSDEIDIILSHIYTNKKKELEG